MSEAASPLGRGEEHAIDLGAVEHDVSASESGPSPPHRRFRIPNVALAYAALVIALAAAVVTVVKWSPLHRPVAETTVLAFLEAVRDGDVEGALALTDQEDAAGAFLAPEALDPRWDIVTVAQVEYQKSASQGRYVAEVYAEIEARDGTRIGHRYNVALENGDARIEDALAEDEAWAPLDYLDMNGVRREIDPDLGTARVMLLPGLYEFYPDLPSTLELEGSASMLVLGGGYLPLGSDVPDHWLPAPWLTVSEEGEGLVNAALREHFDACAADPSGEECPFAFPEDPERELTPAPGAAWEITAYPEIEAERLWFEPGTGFGLQTATPGEVQVTALIAEEGQERTALVSCPIWVDGLYANLDLDGGASINRVYSLAEEHCRTVMEVE
ncbi:MAG TPA: hypothetical protein VHG10_13730 [Glycomyces sp.]|nr:hypothetical protein [Glycomyces sp.]